MTTTARLAFATALALSSALAPPLWAASLSAAVKAAVSDPSRAADQRAQDAARKPEEVLAFLQVKPGQRVIERFPGYSYYTQLLSSVVGPKGKVYVMLFRRADGSVLDIDKAQPVADARPNVALIPSRNAMPQAPEPVDLVLSVQNYHDLHVGDGADVNATMMNRMAFDALKPDGLLVVIDHVAPEGAGASLAPKIHRIEMETAKAEILAAGFTYLGSAGFFRNPADPHTALVSDPSIAGRTDRFVMAFRKPK